MRLKHFLTLCLLFATALLLAEIEVGNFGAPGLIAAGVTGSRVKKIAAFKPDVLIIMVGTDDMTNAKRMTPVEEYAKHMAAIVKNARRLRAIPVLVNLPPARPNQTQANERIDAANKVLQELAAQEKLVLVDLHQRILAAKTAAPAEYLRRGFFTAADSEILAEMIASALKAAKIAPKRIACIGGADTFGYRLNGAGGVEGEPWPAALKRIVNHVSFFTTVEPLPGQTVSRAGWIWYPESFLGRRHVYRGFRRTLTLAHKPESAEITFTGDDRATLFVNGKAAGEVRNWKQPVTVDAAALLVPGKNVIALEVFNEAVDGGGLLKGEIRAQGQTIRLFSDANWKALRVTPKDRRWTGPDFDDSSAPPAWRIGDVKAGPWVFIAGHDYRRFLFPDELAAEESAAKAARERNAKIAAALTKEKSPRVELRYVNGSPKIISGGKSWDPVIFRGCYFDPRDYRNLVYADDFRRAGIHLYSMNFELRNNNLWSGSGKYDFQRISDTLYRLLAQDPEAHFLIGIGVNAPEWWINARPEEAVGYAKPGAAPTYAAKDQYRALRASYASQAWRHDAGAAVRAMVGLLENSPLKSRILAYMPQGGVYDTEWHYYGMRGDMPDTGRPMTAAFRSFLRERYGNDVTRLQKAWGNGSVTFDNAAVPGFDERMHRLSGGIRTVADSPAVFDYLLCHQRVVREAILSFNRAVRDAAGNRPLIGNYSGYFFEMNFPAEGWHLENTQILDSELADFQCSPYGYGDFRSWGAAGLPRAVQTSYRLRNKMLLYEDDTRTHLNFVSGGHFASTPADSCALLGRSFANVICGGMGIWFLDFERGWYHDARLMQTMECGRKLMHRNLPADSVAQVALVCDFDSVIHHSYSDDRRAQLTAALIDGVALELTHAGTPWDSVLVEDLLAEALPDYKVYVFCNMLKFTPGRARIVAELRRRGKNIIWLYAPGIIRDGNLSPESVKQLTGFGIRMESSAGNAQTVLADGKILAAPKRRQVDDSPVFSVEKTPGIEVLGSAKINGRNVPTLALRNEGGRIEVLHTVPTLPQTLLRDLFRRCGVPVWCDRADVVLLANRSLVALHNDRGGSITVTLPEARRVRQVFPQEKVISATSVSKFTVDVPDHCTTIYEILP